MKNDFIVNTLLIEYLTFYLQKIQEQRVIKKEKHGINLVWDDIDSENCEQDCEKQK